MKILHITTSDTGGASNACIRLHLGLLRLGIDSKVLTYIKQRNIPEVYTLYENNSTNFLLKKYRYFKYGYHEGLNRLKLFGRNKEFELFTKPRSLLRPELNELSHWADIINLHWVAYFINYSTFFENIQKPIVWTLHDMNPFTGGCHHSRDCEKFKSECDYCPQLEGSFFPKYSNKNFRIKQEAYKDLKNLRIVTPSQWLLKKSKESFLFQNYNHHHIPNGIDENIFFPKLQKNAREILGFPLDKTILLFTTDWIERKGKGFIFLHEAVNKFKPEERPYICVAGKTNLELAAEHIIKYGYESDESIMSLIYSACDALVLPSLGDNLPNTVIESLLCGTPVIAFPTGGIPEMIQFSKNGLLTKERTAQSLYETIKDFLTSKYNFDKTEIATNAIEKYSLEIQAKSYIEIYKEILNF